MMQLIFTMVNIIRVRIRVIIFSSLLLTLNLSNQGNPWQTALINRPLVNYYLLCYNYLTQLLIVLSPWGFPTFQFACLWCLLLFLVQFSGLRYLACLVWWWICHHTRLLMILVGVFSSLGESDSSCLVCLGLVPWVVLCVMTPLWSHL